VGFDIIVINFTETGGDVGVLYFHGIFDGFVPRGPLLSWNI